MKKYFFSFFLLSIVYCLLSITSASADVICQPIYGGGQTCQQVGPVLIDKKVQTPSNSAFVDNLGVNDNKFAPEQAVNFQLTITNTGNTPLSIVNVKDIFPGQVNTITGPGSINGNVLTFDEINLMPGESRTRTVSAKTVPANQLADGITCVVNQGFVTLQNQVSQDNAQFCIQKGPVAAALTPTPVVIGPTATPSPTAAPGAAAPTPTGIPTKGGLKVFPAPQAVTTPPTGPEAIPLIGLIPTGILGHFLRKKTGLK